MSGFRLLLELIIDIAYIACWFLLCKEGYQNQSIPTCILGVGFLIAFNLRSIAFNLKHRY